MTSWSAELVSEYQWTPMARDDCPIQTSSSDVLREPPGLAELTVPVPARTPTCCKPLELSLPSNRWEQCYGDTQTLEINKDFHRAIARECTTWMGSCEFHQKSNRKPKLRYKHWSGRVHVWVMNISSKNIAPIHGKALTSNAPALAIIISLCFGL